MPAIETELTIETAEATVPARYVRPVDPTATVVLAHGAGAGMDHPFMSGFARALNDARVATLSFNFPYMAAGKKFPDRPPVAVAAWRAAMETARGLAEGGPVWAAGKSFGGRMASMAVAEGMPAAGLVFLGYPLHAPGKPEKLRDEHLYGLSLPMLFLQGTRDPFAQPGELETVAERIGPNAAVEWFEGGDHSFHVARSRRSPEEDGASLAGAVVGFLGAAPA